MSLSHRLSISPRLRGVLAAALLTLSALLHPVWGTKCSVDEGDVLNKYFGAIVMKKPSAVSPADWECLTLKKKKKKWFKAKVWETKGNFGTEGSSASADNLVAILGDRVEPVKDKDKELAMVAAFHLFCGWFISQNPTWVQVTKQTIEKYGNDDIKQWLHFVVKLSVEQELNKKKDISVEQEELKQEFIFIINKPGPLKVHPWVEKALHLWSDILKATSPVQPRAVKPTVPPHMIPQLYPQLFLPLPLPLGPSSELEKNELSRPESPLPAIIPRIPKKSAKLLDVARHADLRP